MFINNFTSSLQCILPRTSLENFLLFPMVLFRAAALLYETAPDIQTIIQKIK